MSFHLRRLQVEQLRQFREPFALEDLAPGLNVLSGPNEAGKSSLVRALRAAFFERHRSTSVDDLRPWGDPSATPTVILDFDWEGQSHHLVKAFLGRKRCVWSDGRQSLEGVAAEDRLAEVFGFSFAGKGASRPEHWGIPGLLWVEQGSAQDLPVQHAREHLHDALRGQAGESAGALAATAGDALLEALRAQRGELLTGTGKDRGPLQEAVAAVAAAAERVAQLAAQVQAYRSQVDQLGQVRAEIARQRAQRPWERLGEELAQARARLEALNAQGRRVADDRQTLERLARHAALLAQQLAALARQREDLAQRRRGLELGREALAPLELAASRAREAVDAAQARHLAAREAVRAARQLAAGRAQALALAQSREAVRRHAAALEAARQAQAVVDALQQEIATLRIDAPTLDALRRLDQTAREAAWRHEAAATRVSVALVDGRRLALSQGTQTRWLSGTQDALLDGPATLDLPDWGTLTITPGGQDLPGRAQAHARAAADLAQALQAAGVGELAAAEAQAARRVDAAARLDLARQAVRLHAPQGLDALRAALGAEEARAVALAQGLAGTQDAGGDPALGVSDAQVDAARAAQAAAEAAQERAQAAEEQARAAHQAAQSAVAAAAARVDAAAREAEAAQAAFDAPDRLARETEAGSQLTAVRAEQELVQARLAADEAALQAARPDIVAQDIQRLSASVAQVEAAHARLKDEQLRLEAALQQAGALGLEEQLEAQSGEHARWQRREAELRRRAQALDLLVTRLEARRQATLARLQAPLQARLSHYLPLLMPGAALEFAESLGPSRLRRPGGPAGTDAGDFAALSFGAREQLGLISRFAYADLLRDAGRPTLLILDDALVHSDGDRLAAMKRVLFDVAQRHQVLLFTCHPGNWQDLGVPVRPLRGG